MTIWTRTRSRYETKTSKVDVKISEYVRLCVNCTNPVIYTSDFKPYCGQCKKVVKAIRVEIGNIEKFRTEYLAQQILAAQYVTDQMIYKVNNTFPIDADLKALEK